MNERSAQDCTAPSIIELLGLRSIGAWLVFVVATFSLTMLFGHELVYRMGSPSTLEGVHGYMDEFAAAWRLGLAGSVLLMFRRVFARGGSVDQFLELPNPRALAARMLFGGVIASSMLVSQELVERAIAGNGVVLELRFIAAILVVQFAIAAALLVLPSWTRAASIRISHEVMRIVARRWSVQRSTSVASRGLQSRRWWDVEQRSDGLPWRCRAVPLRGSP